MSKKDDINLNSNNEDVLLDRYIEDISAYAPLTDEEEALLSTAIRNGDASAKDKLIKANLKFVVSIARQYAKDGCSILDLIDEGNIALINAANRYDAQKGQRFSKYAVWEIRKAIEKFLPSEEIRIKRPASDCIPGNSKDTDQDIEEETNRTEIAAKLHYLPAREQDVLRAYYGIDEESLTMAEIGIKYDLKRERVRQIRNRALRRLYTYRNFEK